MQSSSSVPALILVLCCVASAHKAIHNTAAHHLERRHEGSQHYEPECLQDLEFFHSDDILTYNYTQILPILDTLCSGTCIVSVHIYGYKNLSGLENYADFVCLKHDNRYCSAIKIVRNHECFAGSNCHSRCTDACHSCLDDYIDDYSCCLTQWERVGYPLDATDVCDNSYDTCKRDCSLPAQQQCAQALQRYHHHDDIRSFSYTQISPILDTLCSETCIESVNTFYECLYDKKNYTDYICLKQNNRYCTAIDIVREHLCFTLSDTNCDNTCTDACRTCLDEFVDDFSCCLNRWEDMLSDFGMDTIDVCNNTYDSCFSVDDASSHLASSMLSEPTAVTVVVLVAIVAAALLLIVMAVLVFIRKISRARLPAPA